MDFSRNAQYRQQGHTSRGGQKQRKEEPQDDYMRLSDSEIAGCITDLGFPCSKDEIQRPQPQQIQRIFELIADIIHNTKRETVEPAMRAAALHICGEELMDIVPNETRNLMGFYASLRDLIAGCGVPDFCFTDLSKPTHQRLVKIFSAVINFLRFREQQADVMNKHADALVGTKERIERLHTSNANLEAQLNELRRRKRSDAEAYERKTARNEELKNKLRTLNKEQEQRAMEMERVKAEKEGLTKHLQDLKTRQLTLEDDCNKLRPYSSASGSALQAQLNELHEALKRDKSTLASSEKRLRALQTSADAFGAAAGDVAPCVTLLRNLQADMKAEEKEREESTKRETALTERTMHVRETEREEKMLINSLERWNERTNRLRQEAEERARLAGEKTKSLMADHQRIMAESGQKTRESEKRKVRAEQAQRKMMDLRDNINAEVNAAKVEYMKLKAHIELYVSEMDKVI